MRQISVAVPVPFLDLLTYAVPPSRAMPAVGARVRVPIGNRTVTGCVVESPARSVTPDDQRGVRLQPDGRGVRLQPDIRDILEVLDAEPFLPPAVVELCQWVADYYLAGIGDAIAVALPPGAREKTSGFRTRRTAALTAHGRSAAAGTVSDSDLRLTVRQRAAVAALSAATAPLPLSELRERGITADLVGRLAKHGLVAISEETHERDPFEDALMAGVARDPARQLTVEQASALEQLEALAGLRDFRVALLHGVTGSGKTELYLRLAQRVCNPAEPGQHGRQVLMLVPEIALTPSVAALFRGAFGNRVAIQHSALSDGERHDQWQRIRRGTVDLVIGTRSAVFAPLPRLGLVIVDEEHDSSYKQEEAPRYHGRDVAVMRASREGALVVLGSATPSMESYQNAAGGKYERVVLERRVLDRPLAAVRVVNMRDEYAAEGPDVVISRDLAAAIEDRLSRREQVVVLLNRRGYSTAVVCRQCGDTFDCPNCSISLTVHRIRGAYPAEAGLHQWRARCHYCNYSVMVPKACRKCAAPYLEHTGFGTEKVEQHLRDRFPDARIGRVDRDSVRRKGALASLLSRFAAAELDVLVGTQMIAKGHDFPGVTLVGVISADVGLGLADFRAAERTFQLLTQVAGRAGRGERLGEAVIQTLYPEHYSVRLACAQDYVGFFEKEINFRRGMRYPPLVAMVNAVVRGRTFDEAMQTAAEVVRRLEAGAQAGGFTILGPAPAPLAKLRGEHRVQFFLKGARRAEMRQA
ncbi:MAG TPA: primosomal protein N', partial [Vicinamibacterales bacterium]|nr:primosomal protein N' [Vicinamibacterales bacterium]